MRSGQARRGSDYLWCLAWTLQADWIPRRFARTSVEFLWIGSTHDPLKASARIHTGRVPWSNISSFLSVSFLVCVCVYGYKARASFTLGKHHTCTPGLLSFASLLSVPEGAIPWLSSEPWSLQLAQLESHLPHLPPQNLHLLISLLHRFSS